MDVYIRAYLSLHSCRSQSLTCVLFICSIPHFLLQECFYYYICVCGGHYDLCSSIFAHGAIVLLTVLLPWRHHDHSNLYRWKHLTGNLTFPRFLHCHHSGECGGRRDSGEVAKSFILIHRLTEAPAPGMGVWNLRAQWHTCPNRPHLIILSNSPTPWWLSIQIQEPIGHSF